MGQGSGVAVSCGEGCRLSLDSQAAVAVAVASSCSSGSTPSLGTSICHRCDSKKEKKKDERVRQSEIKLYREVWKDVKVLLFKKKVTA